MSTDDCFICAAYKGDDIPWHDEPVFCSADSVGILPGVGPLIAGYALICPFDHAPSLAAIKLESIINGLESCLDFLTKTLGPVTYWEHGGPTIPGGASSSCVDHAHLHVVPGYFDLPFVGTDIAQFADIRTFLLEGSEKLLGRPYLLAGQSEGICKVGADHGQPQYFRRALASELDRHEDWDYAAVPAFDVVRETIKILSGSTAHLHE